MAGSLLIDCRFNISTPKGLPKHIGGNATISGYGGDLDELLEILKKAAPTG
jgi:hypothetical protein